MYTLDWRPLRVDTLDWWKPQIMTTLHNGILWQWTLVLAPYNGQWTPFTMDTIYNGYPFTVDTLDSGYSLRWTPLTVDTLANDTFANGHP